ncbi:MAG TPA: PAS domain S-box protein, partial [Rhodothermales bacterium]|nr:PAS domain S-box protein [Rhodothermales bacterium]
MDHDTPGTARAPADGVGGALHAAAWLHRLNAVGPALAGARTAEDVAAAVVDHGLAALGAAEGLLAVSTPDGRGLAVVYAARADGLPREARPADLAAGGSLADALGGGAGVWEKGLGVLPLRVGDETLGVLRFTAPAVRAFDGARPFAEALALQATLALDRLRHHAAAEAARGDAAVERARAAFHVALADTLRPLDDPFAIQAEAAALLGRRLGVSRAFYAEADGEHLVISRDYVDGVPHSTARYRLDEFSRDVAAAFRAGRTLAVDDVDRNPSLSDEERARYAAASVRAHATVCLVRDGRLVAMLGVRQTTPRAWSAEDVALMEAAVERTWAHVARARAEEERASAEQERAASERQLRIITDAVPALIAYVDREQRYRFVNRSYTEWFGRTPAQVIGRTSMEVLEPEVYENARPAIEAALRGEPATLEREIPIAGGGTRFIRSRLIPDVGADGTVRGYLALVVDLTEDRARENALRESESRYRALFTAIDEGYCLCELIHDADGNVVDYRFLEVNPLFSSMTGLPADAPGHTARELVPDLEPEWIATYAAVAYGEPSRFEQGSEAMGRWFDVFAMPVEPRGRFALVFKDVTEQKRAAEALRASEERFRQMANTAPAMLWVTDPDGACVFLSEAWYVYTGQ